MVGADSCVKPLQRFARQHFALLSGGHQMAQPQHPLDEYADLQRDIGVATFSATEMSVDRMLRVSGKPELSADGSTGVGS